MITFLIKVLALLLLVASCKNQSTTKHGTMDPGNFDAQVLREIQLLRSDLQKSKELLTDKTEKLEGQMALKTELTEIREQMALKSELIAIRGEMAILKEDVVKQGTALKAHGKSFSAYLTSSVNPDVGDKVIFRGIEHNEGGHYDISTGIFTCPLDGTYFFTMMLYANIYSDPEGIHYNMIHHGSAIGEVHCDNYSDIDIYNMCGNSAVIYCQTGQEVYVKCYAKGNTLGGSASDKRTTFAGFLLHTD